MREPLLVILGAFMLVTSGLAVLLMHRMEQRKKTLGWTRDSGFSRQRRIQLMLCLAAALGIFVLVNNGLGLPSGSGRTNELALVLLLIAGIWLIFRRDIARYQYQISITMLGRARPEPGKEQNQIRAIELVGVGFSFLLGLTGLLLLILNMVFR